MSGQYPASKLFSLETQSGVANWNSAIVDCRPWKMLSYVIDWDADPGTAGTFGIEGCNLEAFTAPVVLATPPLIWWGTGNVIGATAGQTGIQLYNLFAFMRLTCVVAGGVAGQFRVRAYAQSI